MKEPSNSTPPEISNSRRFYPYFKDCIGAIDGTHVRASVPLEIQGRFRGRKDGTTQNVLAAVTFDLRFSYVLAGWEGTAHDSRVLADALSKPDGLNIPRGKYYLADAGYGIQNGIISPYRGVRYHLKEFGDRAPENEKELFNLRHSSLRTTVERAFGVLKKRFRVLDSEPFWSFGTQVDVVLACCIMHNFIMGFDPNDSIMEEMNRQVESQRENARVQLSQREEKEENRIWTAKRDRIAHAMWINYQNMRRSQ
ncbi:protein ALP1-like isoform X1 [Rhodamnia argentea]|uniref:Protein ALP1-like isoform X1 n=1 Tax=Rhodamnia argentea TaxID=178133 RepID=A0A8B8N8J3_9MYRT|nr:protein ALP1-like isoform X1 [Rhodamnia argentea]